MEQKTSLKSIFEAHQRDLKSKLDGFLLPRDVNNVQKEVTNYLNKLLDAEGDFRQNLTQAEDYILQAAMSLLNAQQDIAKELFVAKIEKRKEKDNTFSEKPEASSKVINKNQFPLTLGGTLVGGAAGAIIGSWGAVIGAIAGTAIVLYYASESNTSPAQSTINNSISAQLMDSPLNTDAFMIIVSKICASVDSLIETFRSQINRVVDKYENQQKQTIEKEYRFLLECIQSLLGYERTHDENSEKYAKKLRTRIEDLAECLENYNLTVENYNGSNDSWFEFVVSPESKESRMVLPAIVKNNIAVIKGKVFVPNK